MEQFAESVAAAITEAYGLQQQAWQPVDQCIKAAIQKGNTIMAATSPVKAKKPATGAAHPVPAADAVHSNSTPLPAAVPQAPAKAADVPPAPEPVVDEGATDAE